MRAPQGDPSPPAAHRPAPLGGLDMIRRALLERADLFEDPRAYEAGVADALAAVARIVGDAPVRPHARPLRRRARAGDTPVATARPEGVRVPGG